MKALSIVYHKSLRRIAPLAVRPIGLGISAVVLFVLVGCATRSPVGLTRAGAPMPEAVRLDSGSIGIISPRSPADFSFDKAEGKVENATVGAGNAARAMLETPPLNDAALETGAGALRFALAPFAAAIATVGAGHNRLAADKLSQAESDLSRAMAFMADQQHLRDHLLKAGSKKTRRRLVPIESRTGSLSNPDPVSVGLETRVEELRLERTGSSDNSFALRIKTRARLLRATDGAVLYNQPFEYRSGTDLFLDWTLGQALQNVADTGYRKLAEQIIEQLLLTTQERPVLVGAGFKKSLLNPPDSQFVRGRDRKPLQAHSSIQFANYPVANLDILGIYSAASLNPIAIQRPLTKDQATSEAVRDVEWTLDGLDEFPNRVVQLTAYAAAIPISLWNQTVGAVRGVSRKQFRAADAQLSAAALQIHPHQELAHQVAQRLAPNTAQPVVLMKEPLPAEGEREFAVRQGVARGTLPRLPIGQTSAVFPVSQGTDSALEIHVLSVALKGNHGVNPPLAVCVEARATLRRSRDGHELCALPLHYRSRERKFLLWAANDARLFRQEMAQCSDELGRVLVDQLVSRRLVAPRPSPHEILAASPR